MSTRLADGRCIEDRHGLMLEFPVPQCHTLHPLHGRCMRSLHHDGNHRTTSADPARGWFSW